VGPVQFYQQNNYMGKLTINEEDIVISNKTDLIEVLNSLEEKEKSEIWIEKDDRECLTILINKSRLFSMYLKDYEDGESITCFDETTSKESFENFYLSNGQLDEYPRCKTVDRKFLSDIFLTFYEKGVLTNQIKWI